MIGPKRPPASSPTAADDVSITGGRRGSGQRVLQRRGSAHDPALETFEENVERGTGDARLRQNRPDATSDAPDSIPSDLD